MYYLMIDEDGNATASNEEPELSKTCYPTVYRINAWPDNHCGIDSYDAEVYGANGWQDVKEIDNE